MDSIKIKDKHLFGWGFEEIGAIVKYQLLAARLERIPSDKELNSEVPIETRKRVEERLATTDKTLNYVLEKVYEDCLAYGKMRLVEKERKRRWRNKNKKDSVRELPRQTPPQFEHQNLPGHGENGVVVYLMNQWKARNRAQWQAYPKQLAQVEAEIMAAVGRGTSPQFMEKRILETAGKGLRPWELFKEEHIKKEAEDARLKNIARIKQELL